MNLLMYMVDCTSDKDNCHAGRLEYMTIREICNLGACTENEAWDFIEDALQLGFCNVELDKNRTFHIMSRRLSNDADQRAKWREYKQNQRKNYGGNTDVSDDVSEMSNQGPPVSPIPTPIPTSDIDNKPIAKTWKTDFKIYLAQCRESFKSLLSDPEWVSEQTRLNPGVHIQLTMEKAAVNFWATEAGWKHKKKRRASNINWKSTWQNAISLSMNRVYKRDVDIENGIPTPSSYGQCQDLERRQVAKWMFDEKEGGNDGGLRTDQKRIGQDQCK